MIALRPNWPDFPALCFNRTAEVGDSRQRNLGLKALERFGSRQGFEPRFTADGVEHGRNSFERAPAAIHANAKDSMQGRPPMPTARKAGMEFGSDVEVG